MISKEMAKKINHQINREVFSAYLYLSMSSYAASIGLNGVANWFTVQMQEEIMHAKRFYDYMNQQGERVILENLEAPEKDFKSVLDLYEKTLAHEKIVTSLINELVALAHKENDFATASMLQWFVTEQVEEEANPTEIILKLKTFGTDGKSLYMIDNELAQRKFVQGTGTETGAEAGN